MCHSLAAILFSDCTYVRTDETDETASGGGFDSFENWFRFQQNKWQNRFRFLKCEGVFVISKPVSVSETFGSNGFNSFT